MSVLQGRLLRRESTPRGTESDIALIEPNGDEHQFRCVVRPVGTTQIGGDGDMLGYLNKRYGERVVWEVSRQATLV